MNAPDTPPSARSLTAIILTRNEEVNIGRCLAALAWVPTISLVDSFSTDATLATARATRPDIQTFQHEFKDFGDQRNWALTQTGIQTEWVLFMDADEVCTPELALAIQTAISASGHQVGYFLCYRNIFLGRWIRHCTAFPSWQLRLLKHGLVTYRKEGHGQQEVTSGPLGYIDAPYDHYAFSKGVHEWVDRHNRYASGEAQRLLDLKRSALRPPELFAADPICRRRALARLFARLPFRPAVRFLYLYLWRGGFLDGRPGFLFCTLNFSYRLQIEVKLAELLRQRGPS